MTRNRGVTDRRILPQTRRRRNQMNENNQNKEGGNSPKKNYTALLITLIFTLFIVGAMHSWWQQSRSEMIPYSQFKQMLKDGEIESVVVSNSKIKKH